MPADPAGLIAEALASVVRPLFGPRGRDVLIVAGEYRSSALITNSGSLVLRTLLGGADSDGSSPVRNAIGRYLLQLVTQQDAECGDGCSALIIMIAAGMRHAHKACSTSCEPEYLRRRARLSMSIQWLRRSWIPCCLEPMLTGQFSEPKETRKAIGKDELWSTKPPIGRVHDCIEAMIHTLLKGKFGRAAVDVLSNVMSQWIFRSSLRNTREAAYNNEYIASLKRDCEELSSTWPILHAPGASLGSSQILQDEVLISRPFYREQSMASHTISHSQGNKEFLSFVVVMASFNPASLSQLMSLPSAPVTSQQAFSNAIHNKDQWAARCVEAMAKRQISLLVCTESIPEEFSGHFRRFGMVAIDHVEEWQAQHLCAHAGIDPILFAYPGAFSISDSSNECVKKSIVGRANTVGRVTLGGINCVFIRGIHPHTEGLSEIEMASRKCPLGQLLLRAPSSGLLRQYDRALRRAARVIVHWLSSSDTPDSDKKTLPALAKGGGEVELAGQIWCAHIAHALQSKSLQSALDPSVYRLLQSASHSSMRLSAAEARLAFQTISAILGSVPLALAERSDTASKQLLLTSRAVKLATLSKSNGSNISSLCPSPTELHLARGSVVSPFVVLSTLYRSLDAVSMLLRLEAKSIIKCRVNRSPGVEKSRRVVKRDRRNRAGSDEENI